jgi:3-oxoacyl-[acyl-carrier protein] reductase
VPTTAFDFSGRSVIVTGAARGIGLALATRFADAGAHVFMTDVDESELATQAERLGATPMVADAASSADAARLVSLAVEATGRVDVVINNAGILRDKMLWKLTDEDWDAVLAVHVGGTFRVTRACVPHFREQSFGRVINVTSYTGLHGNVGQAAYAAAKAGIIGFTKTAAKELARFGVTVNAISPNADTRMIESMPPDLRAAAEQAIPAGRFADPAEITAACAFLASDEAAYITGAILPVDGGLSM